MAFAGILETWKTNQGEIIETCCLITTGANSLMEPIHDRMPVILPPDKWDIWLSPNEHHPDKLIPMICPHDSESMQAWAVTRELNCVGLRDDAGLIESL